MNLHFITSVSKDYWNNVGKYCISSWNLPGKVTVYVDQHQGDLKWISEIPHNVELLHVPELKVNNEFVDRRKVLKFWGKSCAQFTALRNRENHERVVWIDSDIEQTSKISKEMFTFSFSEPVAVMNSSDGDDCWESGIVIFNQENTKLGIFLKKYESAWRSEEILESLWKPYDAQVLGYVASERGYFNLCEKPCKNIQALEHTCFKNTFKHWINKENKILLKEKHESKDSNDIS